MLVFGFSLSLAKCNYNLNANLASVGGRRSADKAAAHAQTTPP